jgi:uroporphyrinogen III methyltransferase/synthase
MEQQTIRVGKVYLVGAGPGDPGLLTVRARELLEACDVVVYDALVTPEVLAYACPAAERVYVGKRGSEHALEQEQINALLAEKAAAGLRVVRLKGGDPYLFGRGAEEALYLAGKGVPVEVVPGVTAGVAAPAYAGIPVTHRACASAVAFVTGHEDPDKPESALDWAALAKVGTLCFYMGVKNLGRIAAELGKHLPATTPAAVIQWGSTPRQRTVVGALSDIEEKVRAAGLEAPALTVVGEVVKFREQLNFFEKRPLFGKRVVVTRARAQASDLATVLAALGAEVHAFPMIRIEPPADAKSLAAAVKHLSEFDWVVLTSVNGVDALLGELARQGSDARAFGGARIAAIGPATAGRLAAHGLRADLIPAKYVAEEVVAELRRAGAFADCGLGIADCGLGDERQERGRGGRGKGRRGTTGSALGGAAREMPVQDAMARAARDPGQKGAPRFLLPRADIARSLLPEQLRALGADVTEVVAYRTVPETEGQEEALALLTGGEVDVVTFTSSSTARNFVEILGPKRLQEVLCSRRLRCFSIGPVTSATMKELGLPLHGEAAEHDIPGLVRMMREKA